MENYSFAQQGWQCPICRRVYSPLTPVCFYCGGESKTWTSTGVEIPTSNSGDSTSLDCWDNNPILLTSNPPKLQWKCRYCGKEIITEVTEKPIAPCECNGAKDD